MLLRASLPGGAALLALDVGRWLTSWRANGEEAVMSADERRYHRRVRVEAIEQWSRKGINTPRQMLPIEKDFNERLKRTGSRLFVPLPVHYSDDVTYNIQISYLIDAFDALSARPDIAFDSTWKAFESALQQSEALSAGGNTTDRLRMLAEQGLGEEALAPLLSNPPAQTCEYLFERVIVPPADQQAVRAQRRLAGQAPFRDALTSFVVLVRGKYCDSGAGPDSKRRGAMLLRRALRGDRLVVGSEEICLDYPHRIHLLMSGLLYTARNERFHGTSFSPFVSSAATLRTYCHPHFLFLGAYALLHLLWTIPNSSGIRLSVEEVSSSINENIEEAVSFYGRHWLR
ncbi:hypothetical protein K7640_29205 [Micromonospora sp. PLK6-60]|uniref:hypothetical protein n=1 Tax=Micromonospora sp. PLK6-60 TaxID=2873383 RepID=UPI001CA6B5E8|nr:hypothetical protein [Micromonospora sp. PLK6-60]MBY8875914.1 hypothetical protein [Micromonospora sp. PLK6-60]